MTLSDWSLVFLIIAFISFVIGRILAWRRSSSTRNDHG